jgi:hypothetical protein
MGRKRLKPVVSAMEKKSPSVYESQSLFLQRHTLDFQVVSSDAIDSKLYTALDALHTCEYDIQFSSNGKSRYFQNSANPKDLHANSANPKDLHANSANPKDVQILVAKQEQKHKQSYTNDVVIHEHICIRLPARLLVSYWDRHGLSLQDIHQTIDCTSTVHIWQLALLEKLSISSSSVRIRHSSQTSVSYAGKANAISKLMKIYQERYKTRAQWRSCLTWPLTPSSNDSFDTTSVQARQTLYPFPIHYIRHDVFQKLKDIHSLSTSASHNQNLHANSANPKDFQYSQTNSANPTDFCDYISSFLDHSHTNAAFHKVNEAAQTIQSNTHVPPVWLGQPVHVYSHIISWRDIICIPYRYDRPEGSDGSDTKSSSQRDSSQPQELILMARIVPWKAYLHTYGVPTVLAHVPDRVSVCGETWCVVDEYFYVCLSDFTSEFGKSEGFSK